ncbi:RNA-directed DNA polymerase [Sulfurimonas sp. NWX79]|uniref:RNA-directed DNA polymerase n=1 Tax=Sulfurimonas sp. NWX79 TaxID=2925412 RepID=UPI003204B5A9
MIDLLLKQAYKKLKSFLYTDKTLLTEKIELAHFEQNLESNLKSLVKAIENKDISIWTKNISYTLIVKRIKSIKKEENFYTNQTIHEDDYEIESYNIFIKASIEIHLISVLWTILIGEQLDKELIKDIKGNRLYRDQNNQFKYDSYKLFRPYYEGYQSFRDKAIDMAMHLHKKGLDVTVLNLDIQEFYYNIDFTFDSIKDDIEDKYDLNTLMQEIHSAFHKKVENLKPREKVKYNSKKFLPIGLVSSSIIANYILNDLDKDIKNVKPEYYGRYVDDMLFVFSNANVNLNSKTIVSDLLNCKSQNSKLRTGKRTVQILTGKKKFKLQNKKVKLFHFHRNDSISLLKKFKDKIDENSSFFNFMPDDEKLFKTLESSSFGMFYSDSENKLSSLIGTTKDTLNISKNMSGMLSTVSVSKLDETHLSIYNQQLQNVFSGHNILELRLHWEKVFTYLYISKSYDLFVKLFKDFYHTIEKLSNKELINDTQRYLINSVLFGVAINPDYFQNNLVDQIEDNDIPLNQLLNTNDIQNIREANLFSSYLMTYPLLNYATLYDKDEWIKQEEINPFNYLTNKIELKDIKLKIDSKSKKIQNSPRYIHYHEIILFDFYIHINSHVDRQVFYSTDTKKVLEEYNNFNQFDKNFNNKLPTHEDNKYIITTNSDETKDKLKIGIVSIKTSLKDIEASYVSSPNISYERLQNIFNILNKSIEEKHKVDLLIFPEVSIPYAWIHILARFAKKNSIGLVFGVEHIKIDHKVSNYTCVMLPFHIDGHTSLFINFEAKKYFAPDEKIDIESRGFIANENLKKIPTLYKYRGSVFSTINCYELTDIKYRSSLVGEVDFLVAIEYNKDTNYFSNIIDSLSRDIHCYIVQVNTSDYGDSRIVKPSKTEAKDIVKLKGGENIYLVVDTIDIKELRKFQRKGHCLQKQDEELYKLTPSNFNISSLRGEDDN